MGISQIAAVIAAAGFMSMMSFQLALALGFPLGRMAWGGQHDTLPIGYRIGSVLSAGIFIFASIAVLERAHVVEILGYPEWMPTVVWCLSGFFALGIVMNALSRSPIERRVMTPVAAVLTLLCFIVAATSP